MSLNRYFHSIGLPWAGRLTSKKGGCTCLSWIAHPLCRLHFWWPSWALAILASPHSSSASLNTSHAHGSPPREGPSLSLSVLFFLHRMSQHSLPILQIFHFKSSLLHSQLSCEHYWNRFASFFCCIFTRLIVFTDVVWCSLLRATLNSWKSFWYY